MNIKWLSPNVGVNLFHLVHSGCPFSALFLLEVNEANVHYQQRMPWQGSGCRWKHRHHLSLCVHCSHHNKATNGVLQHPSAPRWAPVARVILSAAHAQDVVRQVSAWTHRDQLELCVILWHPQRQARVWDGRRADLVDAHVGEAHVKRVRVERGAAEAVEILADLLVARLPPAVLGALHHAARLGEQHHAHKVGQVTLQFVVQPLLVQHQDHIHLEGRRAMHQCLVAWALHPAAGVNDAAAHTRLPVDLTALGEHLS